VVKPPVTVTTHNRAPQGPPDSHRNACHCVIIQYLDGMLYANLVQRPFRARRLRWVPHPVVSPPANIRAHFQCAGTNTDLAFNNRRGARLRGFLQQTLKGARDASRLSNVSDLASFQEAVLFRRDSRGCASLAPGYLLASLRDARSCLIWARQIYGSLETAQASPLSKVVAGQAGCGLDLLIVITTCVTSLHIGRDNHIFWLSLVARPQLSPNS